MPGLELWIEYEKNDERFRKNEPQDEKQDFLEKITEIHKNQKNIHSVALYSDLYTFT